MFENITAEVLEWLIFAPFVACFIGSFIGGTAVILVLSTLGGSAGIPWWPMLAGAALGNYASDICWFTLARSWLRDRVHSTTWIAARVKPIVALWANYRRRDWLVFVAVKFAYGLRIAHILTLGAGHYPWSRFLKLDGLSVTVINLTAVLSAWMLGKGISLYMNLFENLGVLVSVIVLAFGLYSILRWILHRRLLIKSSAN